MNALGAGVRLCKGAYKEDKTVAYPVKADVDASFIRLMRTLMRDGTRPAFATHDPPWSMPAGRTQTNVA